MVRERRKLGSAQRKRLECASSKFLPPPAGGGVGVDNARSLTQRLASGATEFRPLRNVGFTSSGPLGPRSNGRRRLRSQMDHGRAPFLEGPEDSVGDCTTCTTCTTHSGEPEVATGARRSRSLAMTPGEGGAVGAGGDRPPAPRVETGGLGWAIQPRSWCKRWCRWCRSKGPPLLRRTRPTPRLLQLWFGTRLASNRLWSCSATCHRSYVCWRAGPVLASVTAVVPPDPRSRSSRRSQPAPAPADATSWNNCWRCFGVFLF